MQAGDLLGPYVLRREIGGGGMAAVFIAKHASRQAEVIVKALRAEFMTQPQTVALFLSEPRALQEVEHENTLEVKDVVAEGPTLYFATELLRGRTLAELLKRGPLDLPRAMQIARQVATVLAHAHDVDVVHRNLKPANVFLVDRDGNADFVKLLELGAVRMQSQGDKPVPGTVIGTPAYMAPEQLRQSAGDHRVDMYSFGVLLYELVVGQRPFVGDVAEIVRQHLLEPAPRARSLSSAVPDVLDTLIAQCLEKDPDARPASMHEVSLSLAALAEKLGAPSIGVDGSTAWVAVPKNTSGYTTVIADAVSAPPAISVSEDDEPSFESVTGETAIAPKDDDTSTQPPASTGGAAVAVEPEIDPALRGPRRKSTSRWPLAVAAGVGALATLVVVAVMSSGPDADPGLVPREPVVMTPRDPVVPETADPVAPVAPVAPVVAPVAPVVPAKIEPPSKTRDRYAVGFGSTPPRAQVWIRMDKRIRLLCNTPCTFELPAGKEVHVELKLDGYKSAQRTITVAEGVRFDGTLRRD